MLGGMENLPHWFKQMEGKGKVSAKEFMNGAGRNSIGQKFTGVKE